ncbi:MAG: undecaprenyldiphospho-muramoylpentapeptide beta-N-acetylglucosaminyltransferase [Clostridia bacterium]|nr:undecaprenyldiphospho-muramoylpentapeptide beta-N-acetylglucosaminyltransferase [Clostridia bacterium]
MRVVMSGGGTAGHINPALAIAKYIQKHEKESEILFIGTKAGMEATLIPKAGFEMEYIDIDNLKRRITLENVKTAVKLVKSSRDSVKILKEFKPDVVIGTGGYVCGPVMMAAQKLKIPSIIHEQNVPPGLVVRKIAPSVDITAISFEETRKYLKNAKRVVLTGNPIREGILNISPIHTAKPLVLVSGGSLGAARINDALYELLTMSGQDGYDILASVGKRYYDGFMQKLKDNNIDLPEGKTVMPYIYNMDEALAKAKIAVTRAGAITVSELCAIGKPAIVIPSPNVAHDHQTKNAEFMADKGAAVMIKEENLSGNILADKIKELLASEKKLNEMHRAGLEIGITNASEKIYELCRELI